jgi:hypothetical protein
MPWGKKKSGNKVCVYKKTTGKILHCYEGDDADARADKYLAALYAYAHHKEYDIDNLEEVSSGLYMMKEADGRYMITTVSTAAVVDQEGEIFDVDAIDWDIKEAKRTGEYPEFRVFHKPYFGIGRVESMSRVGIFAVDRGHSYTDPFSLEVCEKMLANNDGRWRCSRGFALYEASGKCPVCDSPLILNKEHMEIGFRCPSCKSVHISYKGVLKELHFRKARTFDVTITDIPAVPYTGASAIRSDGVLEVKEMNKQQLREKLLKAGISEEVIDQRLNDISDSRLKEFDDIPDAILMKEFEDDGYRESDDELFVLDPDVLKEFASIARDIVREELDNMEIEVDATVMKEDELFELKEKVDAIYNLLISSKKVTKEVDIPRNGKLRVARFKQVPMEDEEDMEDDEDMEDEEDDEEVAVLGKKKKYGVEKELPSDVLIQAGDGSMYKSMTDMIVGRK